jgi:hypothetical protein
MTLDISPLWIVAGLVLFVLGVRWTISQAARRAYENTKAQVPIAKAAAKGTLWAAARAAALVLILLAALSWFDLRRHDVDTGGWLMRLQQAVSGGARPQEAGRTKDGNVICFSAECRRQHPERP